MKKRLLFTLALVMVLAIAVVACSKLKGVTEKETKTTTPTTTTTTTTTPEPEAGKVTKTKVGSTTNLSGVLRGVNDSNKFDIFTEKQQLSITFTWPKGAEYHVKVHGMSGDELGDFNLNDGEIIDLSGGGKFSLTVYSRSGEGAWSGTYTE